MDHPTPLAAARCSDRFRGLRALVGLLLVLSLAPGCVGVYGTLKKALRKPGEKLKAFPEEVWSEYDCDGRHLPFVRIEKDEVAPARVRAGSEFNHRMVYVLCPSAPTKVLTGTLDTRILFHGRSIVRELDRSFEIKPGRWVVDTFIQVPEQAKMGIYALQVEFKSPEVSFERRLTFAVDRSDAKQANTRTRSERP